MPSAHRPQIQVPVDWFHQSPGAQRFLWAVRGSGRRGIFLLAANAAGYRSMEKQLEGLFANHGKGAQRRSVRIGMTRPARVPSALIWFGQKPALARAAEVTLDEITAHYRKAISGFEGFHWYDGLDIGVEPYCEIKVAVVGNRISLRIDWENLEKAKDHLHGARFPCHAATTFAADSDGGRTIWLAADWLGAE